MTATRLRRRSFIVFLSLVCIEGCVFEWDVVPDIVLAPAEREEKEPGHDAAPPAVDSGVIDSGVADSDIADSGIVDSGDPDACVSVCDCDDDGYYDLTREGCADAGGPSDCDDHDKRTHPGQEFRSDPATAARNGDWNCENGVERLVPPNVSCGLLALGACGGVGGFKGNPRCGEEGVYVTCEVQLALLCVESATTSTRRQQCK